MEFYCNFKNHKGLQFCVHSLHTKTPIWRMHRNLTKSMWIFGRPVRVILDICITAYSNHASSKKNTMFHFYFVQVLNLLLWSFHHFVCSYFTSLLVHNIFTKFTAFFPLTHTIKSVTTKRNTFSQPNTLHHFTKNMCTTINLLQLDSNFSTDSTVTVFINGVISWDHIFWNSGTR